MIMVNTGSIPAFYKKWIHFDLNQVGIIIFNVEAISKALTITAQPGRLEIDSLHFI